MEWEGIQRLLERARDGDGAAMDEALERLKPQLERLASRYANPGRPVASTRDLLQECCIRAWEKIGNFRGGNSDEETFKMFRAWTGKILLRLGQRLRRERFYPTKNPPKPLLRLDPRGQGDSTRQNGAIDPPAMGPSPSDCARRKERADRIRTILAALEEVDREIVWMHFALDLSLPEISVRLNLPFEEVRRRYRASVRRVESEWTDGA